MRGLGNNQDLVISIPLKNSTGSKTQELNEDFVKVIEYEYAVRYLEMMGIEANAKMIQNLLKTNPLSSCELSSGWNNSGSLADVLYIYPNKKKKKTFENNREEFQYMKQLNDQQQIERNKTKVDVLNQASNKEDIFKSKPQQFYEQFQGMLEDKRPINQGLEIAKKLYDSLPGYKKKAKFYEYQRVKQEMADAAEAKRNDLNLNVERWKNKFLFPFGNILPMSDIPIDKQNELPQTDEEDCHFKKMVSQKYLYPIDQIHKQEWLKELQVPIQITVKDIIRDLFKFTKDFPVEVIPHMTEEEVKYKNREKSSLIGSKLSGLDDKGSPSRIQGTDTDPLLKPSQMLQQYNKVHFDKSQLNSNHVQTAFLEINTERTARLIGLLSHFIYWIVFGHINQLPIDNYHLKQLFVSILQQIAQLEMSYEKNRIFANFMMPMIILSIRIEIETVYKQNYPRFFMEQENEDKAMQLINGAITELIDPKIYYSRFSFLESGKEAIDLKFKINKRGGQQSPDMNGGPLPNLKNKYYTRSTLVRNLIPQPSEGKVRAMFGENPISLPKLKSGTSRSPERSHLLSQHLSYQSSRGNLNKSPILKVFPNRTMKSVDQNLYGEKDEDAKREARLFDMLNKVQMFQIAGEKVNKSLKSRKLSPIFSLRIDEKDEIINSKINKNRQEEKRNGENGQFD